MTLEELDQTLPNGLHDARIKSLSHDYESAIVKFEVEILFGLPDDPPADRFRCRDSEVLFHQVLFCSVEVPEMKEFSGIQAAFGLCLTESSLVSCRGRS